MKCVPQFVDLSTQLVEVAVVVDHVRRV